MILPEKVITRMKSAKLSSKYPINGLEAAVDYARSVTMYINGEKTETAEDVEEEAAIIC